MNISLDLPIGEWRYLDENEMSQIKEMVSDSSKTYE